MATLARFTARIRSVVASPRADAGMTTAEYAVGTVAACGFAGLLYKILTSTSVMHALQAIVMKALHLFA